MIKNIYIFACIMAIALGVYAWRIKSSGVAQMTSPEDAHDRPIASMQASSVVVEVGEERITQEDIDWEYELVTSGLQDKDSLTAIPDLGGRLDQELSPLRKALIGNIIERKLLFQFIQFDRDFRFDDSSRYTACLAEWQAAIAAEDALLREKIARERLKDRLCERSILEQYIKERVFASIEIKDDEVVEYYKNYMNEFRQPEMVEIRQILLADEATAKKIRNRVTTANFSELAKEHSIAPEASAGGLIGPFAKGAMPSVFDIAFKMRKDQISDVLKSNYGYHIFMLVRRLPQRDLGLEEARGRIVAKLRARLQDEAYREWVERALAAITVSAPKSVW